MIVLIPSHILTALGCSPNSSSFAGVAFLWPADGLRRLEVCWERQGNSISLHPLTSVVITFAITSPAKFNHQRAIHASRTMRGECLLSGVLQSELHIEWLRDSIVSGCHKKNLFKENLIFIIFSHRGGERRWERFQCMSWVPGWQSTGLEDVRNFWEQKILNFNLGTLIRTELLIYLCILSTKSSLTTGHKYIVKHNTPACFTIPFFFVSSI